MRRRRHKLQVSTFPFLAVLLCAMGALLLVLLVMDRRAHDAARARAVQAARRAAEEAARDVDSRRAAEEQEHEAALAARQREREAQHAVIQGQVVSAQGEVRSVRDQIAQADERLRAEEGEEAALKRQVEAANTAADAERQVIVRVRDEEAKSAAQSDASRKELAAMTADLAALVHALADLKAAREKEQKTYSVVPYNGKKGENRRPVYVECAGGQLIFHPDRLSLPESRIGTDAEAEVGRRLAVQKEQLPTDQASAFAPYLMLLVRPDGVVTYYRFRDALRSLKIDFGYEFIDADWSLAFPADDDTPAPPWTTAAKPAAVAPSVGPAGAPLAGYKPGFGPAASAGGPPSAGPGGPLIGDGPGPRGANDPAAVAPSAGPAGASGHGPVGRPSGSQFDSSNLAANGSAGGPVLGDPRASGAGTASAVPTRDGPQTAGPAAPAVTGPPRGDVGGSPGVPGTTKAASGAAKDGSATNLPTVPGPTHDGSSAGQASTAASTDTPAWGPKTGTSGAPAGTGPKDGTPATGQFHGPAAKTAPGGASHDGAGGGDDDPFLHSPPSPLPNAARPAPSLRPARLSGDRDWLIYVECKPEGVVVYPTQLLVPASTLAHSSGGNPLAQSIQQLIDRKQASVRPGDPPYRPEVRFLVHADAGRTYHLAYPLLDGLAAPKTAQDLTPDDDVSAIVTGHP